MQRFVCFLIRLSFQYHYVFLYFYNDGRVYELIKHSFGTIYTHHPLMREGYCYILGQFNGDFSYS